jgi:hypothetical protein
MFSSSHRVAPPDIHLLLPVSPSSSFWHAAPSISPTVEVTLPPSSDLLYDWQRSTLPNLTPDKGESEVRGSHIERSARPMMEKGFLIFNIDHDPFGPLPSLILQVVYILQVQSFMHTAHFRR